jgi:hypothetical protein
MGICLPGPKVNTLHTPESENEGHKPWLLKTGTDPWKLSGRFLGSITMVLKNQRLVLKHNHGSQSFEKSINQPYHHQMVLVLLHEKLIF